MLKTDTSCDIHKLQCTIVDLFIYYNENALVETRLLPLLHSQFNACINTTCRICAKNIDTDSFIPFDNTLKKFQVDFSYLLFAEKDY